MDVAFETWLEVLGLKRGENEDITKYLLRFDTICAKLQQSAVPLPNALLSLHLLHSLNIDEMQRRCIVSNISLDSETVLDDMKTAVRLLKSSIVEKNVKKPEPEDKVDDQSLFIDSRRRSGSRGRDFKYNERTERRSGSRGRNQQRSSEQQYYEQRNRSGSRNQRFDRSKSNEGWQSYDKSNNQSNYSNRDYNNRRNYNNQRNYNRTYESINYTYEGNIDNCESVLLNLSQSLRCLTLDSATTKTCIGRKYKDDMVASSSDTEKQSFETYSENRSFKFGNGVRYPSKSGIKIPIVLGKLRYDLFASIIDANIPLLVGNPDMRNMGLSINFEKDKAFISKTNEYFDLNKNGNGLLTLPLNVEPMKKETHEILKVEGCSEEELEKKVKKVHEVLCHPREEVLKSFYKDSSEYNYDTRNAIEKVSRECPVRLKFKGTPSRPKVRLPFP